VKINSPIKLKSMKTKMVLTTLAIVSAVIMGGCKSNDLAINNDNPSGIPVQKTSQSIITLGGAANFAILAGSAITSTGATNIRKFGS
jgi:hypothetical protein